MPLFRHLLFWILLALAGALLAQVLLLDPGYVLVRYLGTTIEASLVGVALLFGLTLFALWLLWRALAWPFRSWRRRRERVVRSGLSDGLEALHLGRYAEAERLLSQAAQDPQFATMARIGAARAAAGRGDSAAVAGYLDALPPGHAPARAIALAELALAESRSTDALAALSAVSDDPNAPRLAQLRAQAAEASLPTASAEVETAAVEAAAVEAAPVQGLPAEAEALRTAPGETAGADAATAEAPPKA